MIPVTENEIRGSFINCSKGEAKRLNLPRDLDSRRWEDLDFLGWRDPMAHERAYLVWRATAEASPAIPTRLPTASQASYA
jgi:hypothetical protein